MGSSGGKQTPSPPCHLCSAGKVELLLCVARASRQGAERAHVVPLQIDHPPSLKKL